MTWREKYNHALKNIPESGTELKAKTGKAIVKIDLVTGSEPFVYGRAYVNNVVGEEPLWFLATDYKMAGLKVVLMPNSRDKLLREQDNILKDTVEVEGLRIIKKSFNGSSLLAELL